MPSARARSRGSVKVVVRMVSVAGASIAAPRPCTARAITSASAPGARPHTRLASVNSVSPQTNTRRRPYRSAARPPSSRKPAKISV